MLTLWLCFTKVEFDSFKLEQLKADKRITNGQCGALMEREDSSWSRNGAPGHNERKWLHSTCWDADVHYLVIFSLSLCLLLNIFVLSFASLFCFSESADDCLAVTNFWNFVLDGTEKLTNDFSPA